MLSFCTLGGLRSGSNLATLRCMQSPLSYRHRVITEDDLVFIRKLIADHPGSSRRDLSIRLCQAWNWVQANGALRDMVCRGLMLMLHRQGLIELPPARQVSRNPMVDRAQPALVSVDESPLQMALNDLGPLELRQVRRAGAFGGLALPLPSDVCSPVHGSGPGTGGKAQPRVGEG